MGQTRAKRGDANDSDLDSIDAMHHIYSTAGFDFNKLTSNHLQSMAGQLGLDIGRFTGKKPLKPDYLFAIERHYAHERRKVNKHVKEHLAPDFHPSRRHKAYIRQIMAQHDIKYVDNGKLVSSLNLPELYKAFSDCIEDMRAQLGVQIPTHPNPTVDRVANGIRKMGMNEKQIHPSGNHNAVNVSPNGQQNHCNTCANGCGSFNGTLNSLNASYGASNLPGRASDHRSTTQAYDIQGHGLNGAPNLQGAAPTCAPADRPWNNNGFGNHPVYHSQTPADAAQAPTVKHPVRFLQDPEIVLTERKIRKMTEQVGAHSSRVLQAIHETDIQEAIRPMMSIIRLLEAEIPTLDKYAVVRPPLFRGPPKAFNEIKGENLVNTIKAAMVDAGQHIAHSRVNDALSVMKDLLSELEEEL